MDSADLIIPEGDWRKLLAACSGDGALLYLYLRAGGDAAQAETALRLSPSRMDCASATLKQMGLWPEKPRILRPAEPPTYSEAEVIRQLHSSEGFNQLLGEAQRRLGKVLNTEELKILLSLYDYLGLPAEVISLLISYCIQRARSKGTGRMPSMRAIEREAYRWADLGIDTMEEAAAHMQLELEQQSKIGAMRRVLQLTDRRLSPGEEKLVRQWISWGFSPEAVALAYDRTCLRTGSFSWKYIRSILTSWHEQGLHTVAEIEAGDKRPAGPQSGQSGQSGQQPSAWAREAVARMMQTQEE